MSPVVPGLRPHQELALERLRGAEHSGRRRSWVVLPPGAGKTRLGVEWARDLGIPTVVLSPNTAIRGQWARTWQEVTGRRAGEVVGQPLTALTYQSLANFELGGAEGTAGLLDRLHPHGRALVEQMRALPELLLVLDECHHLLQVWGRLLDELLAALPNARVLGLTATPAQRLTPAEDDLVARLFGAPVHEASIPALVRAGELAPFAELAWFCAPDAAERDWLAEHTLRFTEFTTAVLDPTLGDPGLLAHLDRRFVQRPAGGARDGSGSSWARLARQEPALCDAALRLHHAGLLALPPGARPGEAHRRDPGPDDWRLLLDDWVRVLRRTGGPSARVALDWLHANAPAIGWQLTRHRLRHGPSPVDRVLALSRAKVQATVEVVRHELTCQGPDARVLVLCDHEAMQATRQVAATDGRPEPTPVAGSARAVLLALLEAGLPALMVTGRGVAGSREVLDQLRGDCAQELSLEAVAWGHAGGGMPPGGHLGPDLPTATPHRLVGPWTVREWVPAVTERFATGRPQVLVGTRALLGEGWDAPGTTCVVDLTSATTSAAVVQARGRGLRLDPRHPGKVATTWSISCVAPGLPGGDADHARLVRKHAGFVAPDLSTGVPAELVEGVAHLDARLSPFQPPAAGLWDAMNAQALVRSEDREAIARAWAVGSPLVDESSTTLRVRLRDQGLPVARPTTAPTPVPVLPPRRAMLWQPAPADLLGVAAAALPALLLRPVLLGAGLALLVLAATLLHRAGANGRRTLRSSRERPTLDLLACAVADALAEQGHDDAGARAVRLELVDDEYRARLEGAGPATSSAFATALDELVGPVGDPRYLVPRWSFDGAGWAGGLRAALGRPRPTGMAWHAVPTVFGTSRAGADDFAGHFDRWVGGGRPVWSRSPEGEGALVVARGQDPLAQTTVLRTAWR